MIFAHSIPPTPLPERSTCSYERFHVVYFRFALASHETKTHFQNKGAVFPYRKSPFSIETSVGKQKMDLQ